MAIIPNNEVFVSLASELLSC